MKDSFDKWYEDRAKKLGLNPNPDDPRHFYDYRAAYDAGAEPDSTGHWPSEFKREGHPNMIVNGVNTKTGKKVPPRDPLADEASPFGQKLNQDFINDEAKAKKAHVAKKIREEFPELRDAGDDDTLIQAVRETQLPDASDEDFVKTLDEAYGHDFKYKGPGFVEKAVKTGAATVADMAVGAINDVAAFPRGAFEAVQGVAKLGAGQLQAEKNSAFGAPQEPSADIQEGKALLEKSQAHFGRASAFAASIAAASATAGLVNPLTARLGTKFIPKIIGNTLKFGAEFGAFSGPYEGIREASKPDASPEDVWNALEEGTKSGVVLGTVAGAGGTIVAGIAKSVIRAMKVGNAVKGANTLEKAGTIPDKLLSIFDPAWHPTEIPAEKWTEDFVTKFAGPDIAASPKGKATITEIVGRIKKYQDDAIKNNFKRETETVGNGSASPESPKSVASKKQATTPEGTPIWIVGIEKDNNGLLEIHNIQAPLRTQAVRQAEELATEIGGKVRTDVESQYERRLAGKMPGDAPTRRVEDYEAMPLEKLTNEISIAKTSTEKERLLKVLEKRELGSVPKEGDVTKNSTWTKNLKDLTAEATAKPEDIKVQDEAFKAKSNFEAWKNLRDEKKLSKIHAEAVNEIESLHSMSAKEVSEHFEQKHPNFDLKKHNLTNPEAQREFMLRQAQAALPAKPVSNVSKVTGQPKINPAATLMVGRGAHGSVRIEFPSELHAELYSLLGRQRKLMSGDLGREERKTLSDRVSSSLDRILRELGGTRADIAEIGRTYRKKVNEFIKGHPTYDESGKILKAPDFDKISEFGLDPEALKRLIEAQRAGLIKDDPTLVEKILADGKAKKFNAKEALLDYSTKKYKKQFENSPMIENWSIFDPSKMEVSPLSIEIANHPEYKPLLEGTQHIFDEMQKILVKHDSKYGDVDFVGFITTKDLYGGNAPKSLAGVEKDQIFINPWNLFKEVLARVSQKITPSDFESIRADLCGSIVGTIQHELAHQVIRNEEGEALSAVLTQNIGFLNRIGSSLQRHTEGLIDEKLLKLIEEHSKEVRKK